MNVFIFLNKEGEKKERENLKLRGKKKDFYSLVAIL
jgi:hypothetical protein